MMRSFRDVLQAAQRGRPSRIAVAVAEDEDVLLALADAYRHGLAQAALVGDRDKIKAAAGRAGIELGGFDIVHEPDAKAAARQAVALVSSGQAQLVMKGLISTADILRAVLDKEIGLRTGRVLSHVAVMEIDGYDRLMLLTDAAMNIAPDVSQKAQIVQNAVIVAKALGIKQPKVAPLAAVEVANPDMPATLDAAILAKMADRGQLKGCLIDGPLALDNAVSPEAARHKGITSPVAGMADILLAPNIETGNALYKSVVYFAKAQIGGIIAGAKAPVILTSRADSPQTKLNSIALGVIVSQLG
ncbi:phosphate butyryltransferase [Sporolituus thermophilus]|uniref:Phosphate butyryltransferase n=1 Tax=Sporolituus thermophilus DSM 23256 TaxID=1123285 RepID=A0A1G7N8D1_9FIRM|nr:phosphate butyryltransferase [Sporolituus thermophilus]SDF70254.1 phosphate butyryltransferase [Sporolituus thermophilus DSM 23256]